MGTAINLSKSVTIEDESAVGEARRRAQDLATALGFGDNEIGKIAIVVTELAGNIVKHARRGEILLRGVTAASRCGLEAIALDRGAGMANVAECLRDGYSTAGSPGTGLGAARRLSQTFEIYSAPSGTAALARFWNKPFADGEYVDVGVVCAPKPGEEACGDNWAVKNGNLQLRVLLSDGLGHGPQAAEAANLAVTAFSSEKAQIDPTGILTHLHAALRRTRGAAAAVANIDFRRGLVRYAGVGNISACIMSPAAPKESLRMVSQNGTLGVEMRKVQEFSYPWAEGSCLIMHSDGLASRWDMEKYPGLLRRDPALIAAVLYRDYRRGTDDVSVLVARRGAAH